MFERRKGTLRELCTGMHWLLRCPIIPGPQTLLMVWTSKASNMAGTALHAVERKTHEVFTIHTKSHLQITASQLVSNKPA